MKLVNTPGTGSVVAGTNIAISLPATSAGSAFYIAVATTGVGTVTAFDVGIWTKIGVSLDSHNNLGIWRCALPAVPIPAGTTTINVTLDLADNAAAAIIEADLHGMNAGSGTGNNGAGTSTAVSSGATTGVVLADTLLVAAAAVNVAETAGPSGGFTSAASLAFSSPRKLLMAYKIQRVAANGTCGWTLGSAANWDAVVVAENGTPGPSEYQTDDLTDQVEAA